MERQLSVWAAPGLVLAITLMGFFLGHFPGSGLSHGEEVVGAAAEPAPAVTVDPEDVPLNVTQSVLDNVNKPEPPEPGDEDDDEGNEGNEGEDDVEEPIAADDDEGGASGGVEVVEPTSPGSVAGTGTLRGRILFDGKPPVLGPLKAKSDGIITPCCLGDEIDLTDRSLLVSPDGGVADVVITVKAKGGEVQESNRVFEMDQRCCRFEPHVLVVWVGDIVRFLNSDEEVHNVRFETRKNPRTNKNLAGGTAMEVPTERAEVIVVQCDFHTWMGSFIAVSEYRTVAKTDAEGNFEITGIPPGTWSVDIWGESVKATERRLKVDITADAVTQLDFEVEKK